MRATRVISREPDDDQVFNAHLERGERKRAENTREGTEEVSFGRVRVEGGNCPRMERVETRVAHKTLNPKP